MAVLDASHRLLTRTTSKRSDTDKAMLRMLEGYTEKTCSQCDRKRRPTEEKKAKPAAAKEALVRGA